MKRIRCEACGSDDLVFQDGFLLCKACGMKYRVAGIEDLDQKKYYRLALRRAYEEEDHRSVKRYCNILLDGDIDDWEAFCYSGLADLYLCDEWDIASELIVFSRSIEEITERIFRSSDDPDELRKIIERVNRDMMMTSKHLYDKTDEYHISDELAQTIRFNACLIISQWNNQLRKKWEESDIDIGLDKDLFINDYKQLVKQLYEIRNHEDADLRSVIRDLLEYIHTEDPEWDAERS